MDKDRLADLIKRFGPTLARDGLGVLGLSSIVRGVAMVNAPAAWVVAGFLMAGAAFLLSKRGA